MVRTKARESAVPAARWRDIADDIRARIARGEWAPGDQLPPQRDLMTLYGTSSRSTIARAMNALVAEGVLHTDPSAPRSGMHVRARHLVRRDLIAGLRLEHDRAVSGDTSAQGLFEATTGVTDPVEVNITYEHNVIDTAAAALLDLTAGAPLLLRTFRYAIDGEPHQLVWSYLPEATAHAAGMTDEAAEIVGRGTIAQLLDAGITVDRVQLELESRIPTTAEIGELSIAGGVPVVVQRRISYAAGRPVAMQEGVVPGDRIAYTLTIDLAREDSP